jgi:hypothetical protein
MRLFRGFVPASPQRPERSDVGYPPAFPLRTLAITSPNPLPSATINLAYSLTLTASGGTPPYQWAAGGQGLPTGLSLAATTGTISGTPTTIGSYTFPIQVTGSAKHSATEKFTLTVAGPTIRRYRRRPSLPMVDCIRK